MEDTVGDDWNVFRIPKKSGGTRLIEEPPADLKEKQRKAVKLLRAYGIGPGKWSTGFVKGKSIKDHAIAHFGCRVIVSIDMRDAFHKIKPFHVRTSLSAEKVPANIVDEIIKICFYKGRLSMGSPSSPDLLNIVCKHLVDPRIAGIARVYMASYTRYADNIELSSDNENLKKCIPVVANILRDVGMSMNRKKVKIMWSGRRQTVTGLVVNWIHGETKPRARVKKSRLRRFRSKLHNAKIAVLVGERPKISFARAYGFAAFVNMTNPALARRFRVELKFIKQAMRHRKCRK